MWARRRVNNEAQTQTKPSWNFFWRREQMAVAHEIQNVYNTRWVAGCWIWSNFESIPPKRHEDTQDCKTKKNKKTLSIYLTSWNVLMNAYAKSPRDRQIVYYRHCWFGICRPPERSLPTQCRFAEWLTHSLDSWKQPADILHISVT